MSNKLAADSAQLSNLRQQQQNAHAVVDRKHQLESHRQSLFDQVVNEQPATPVLQQLQANSQQQCAQLASEQALLQAVGHSMEKVTQGLSLFQKAEGIYRQASQINERAQRVNSIEGYEARRERRDEAFGDGLGAENAEWNREQLERQERHLQAERDSLVNRAHDVAMQAYQVISIAFSTFPMEARGRYPDLSRSIGQVAFPRVEGANFSEAFMADAIFGTMGAAMNDFSSGCKIHNNVHVVEQCASMTSQQLGLVSAMHRAVHANVQQLQVNLQTLEQSVVVERTSIFNSVQAAVAQLTSAAA
jgi:hypothetical protein